jgi:hypothetical protein
MSSSHHYVIATVSSLVERDKLIKQIYTNLTKEPSTQYTVQQDQVNRIKILQNCGKGVYVPIRTYLVIVIPVLIDLSSLYDFTGIVDYRLDKTIESLKTLITKLESLQGRRVMRGKSNEQTFNELVRSLC